MKTEKKVNEPSCVVGDEPDPERVKIKEESAPNVDDAIGPDGADCPRDADGPEAADACMPPDSQNGPPGNPILSSSVKQEVNNPIQDDLPATGIDPGYLTWMSGSCCGSRYLLSMSMFIS